MRIFVAGPYNADNVIDVLRNMRKGLHITLELINKGHSPFCPWLDYQYSLLEHVSMADYKRMSIDWLMVSDALYYIAPSPGADAELAIAQAIGIPIYRNMNEVPEKGSSSHESVHTN